MSVSTLIQSDPRVAIISTGELFGGVERHILTLCRSLRTAPTLVVLFNEGLLAKQLRKSGANVIILNRRRRFDHRTARKLRDLIIQYQIQVVHIHGYVATVYLYLARGVAGPTVVKTEHGLPETDGLFSLAGWKAHLYRWLEILATRRLRAFIVFVSRDIESRTGRFYRGLMTDYVPNGIELQLPTGPRPVEYPAKHRIIVGVGRLDYVKGFDIAIDAFSEIARSTDDTFLAIVGDGPQRDRLSRRISDLGLAGRAALVGFRDDVGAYLANADVLVMPSRHEGLPFVLLEAMLCGTPVIAAKTGGLAETITDGETGRLFRAGDSAGLAHALKELLCNSELRAWLARHARRLVTESYSGEAMAARYVEIYRQCVEHSGIPQSGKPDY